MPVVLRERLHGFVNHRAVTSDPRWRRLAEEQRKIQEAQQKAWADVERASAAYEAKVAKWRREHDEAMLAGEVPPPAPEAPRFTYESALFENAMQRLHAEEHELLRELAPGALIEIAADQAALEREAEKHAAALRDVAQRWNHAEGTAQVLKQALGTATTRPRERDAADFVV